MPQTEDRQNFRAVALVTGASGGIGADLARVFARNGHDLALVARGAAALEALAAEIEASGRPRPLTIALDLAAPDAADRLQETLAAAGARVEILVNNAGFGLVGEVALLPEDGQLAMIDLNVRVLTQLCRRFLPDLKAVRGKILNVASVASYFPGGPGMTVYYATKAYVLSFTLGLAQELLEHNVAVSALCPGMTPTGFQARAGFAPGQFDKIPATSSMSVAEAGYRGLMAGRREIIPGAVNLAGAWLMPLAPGGAIWKAVLRAQKGRQ